MSDTNPTLSPASQKWLVITKPFHQFVDGEDEGAKQAALDKLFEQLVGSDHNDAAVEALSNPDFVPDNDILLLFTGKPIALVRRAISEMRKLAAPPVPEVVTTAPTMRQGVSILPQAPDDEGFLALLKTGGQFKFGEAEAVSAVRVLMSHGLNLDRVEKMVLEFIEERAENLNEQVPEIFYEIDKTSLRKRFPDVFSALGISPQTVTAERRKKTLASLVGLFGDIADVHEVVAHWNKSWTEAMSNPALVINQMAAFNAGGAGLMPAMMEAPDSGPVLASAESFREKLNGRFSGTRIPVIRTLAAETLATVRFLKDPKVISATGAGSTEELYKKLDVQVSAEMVRAERAAVQYLLAILQIDKVDTQQLPMYISSLAQLGNSLPWRLLTGANPSPSAPQQVTTQRSTRSAFPD